MLRSGLESINFFRIWTPAAVSLLFITQNQILQIFGSLVLALWIILKYLDLTDIAYQMTTYKGGDPKSAFPEKLLVWVKQPFKLILGSEAMAVVATLMIQNIALLIISIVFMVFGTMLRKAVEQEVSNSLIKKMKAL